VLQYGQKMLNIQQWRAEQADEKRSRLAFAMSVMTGMDAASGLWPKGNSGGAQSGSAAVTATGARPWPPPRSTNRCRRNSCSVK
jgi:hypothetical protein